MINNHVKTSQFILFIFLEDAPYYISHHFRIVFFFTFVPTELFTIINFFFILFQVLYFSSFELCVPASLILFYCYLTVLLFWHIFLNLSTNIISECLSTTPFFSVCYWCVSGHWILYTQKKEKLYDRTIFIIVFLLITIYNLHFITLNTHSQRKDSFVHWMHMAVETKYTYTIPYSMNIGPLFDMIMSFRTSVYIHY